MKTNVNVARSKSIKGILIAMGFIFIIKKPTANPIKGKPNVNDARSIPFKSSFFGYKAATKEYPGNTMSKIPKIVIIIFSLNLGTKIKLIAIIVMRNINRDLMI